MDKDPDPNTFENNTLNPIEDIDSSGRPFVWLILGAATIGCGVIFAAAFFFFQPNAQSLVDKYFPSPTATPTLTPTQTPTIPPSPTPNRTAQAYEATAVYAAGEWRETLSEKFESDQHGFYVDTDDDEYAKIIYEVKDGKYTWDATAHQGFFKWIRANAASIDDFYFALEATQSGFTTAADYGIVFRHNALGNFYYFSINNKKLYSLWVYNHNEWTVLIEETQSSAIRPREANKIAILAEGDHFVFFINDQYLTDIRDGIIDKGQVGMAIEVFDPDLNVVFEFDNILLKRPK